jgi:predicted acylesterase/phospholipase RssA
MLAVAFEGCACRAAFHAGVAAALAERALPIALTAGASSGSLIAVGLAADRGAELPAIWRALGGRSIISWRRLAHNRSPFDMSHLVRTMLEATLGGARADLRAHRVEALVTATRLRDLRRVVFSTRDEPDMLPPLLGSCFFPLLYGRTVRVRGDLYIDGGLVDNLPLEALAERGAREILAVTTRADGTALKTPFDKRWRPRVDPRSGARVHVIHPKKPLAIRSWDFAPDAIARAIDDGYDAARRFLG